MAHHRTRFAAPAVVTVLLALWAAPADAQRTPIAVKASEPYLGAIVVDAQTGKAIVEDNADAQGYPASVVKLMDMLLVLESVKQGSLTLSNTVEVTAEASRMGGSQVYLKEHEVFTVEDLLYALMIQSANDAATALAIHVAGTTKGFVQRMNKRAKELGMANTEFHSVHGLPPSKGTPPDVSTARDLAVLARELISRFPETLIFTSTVERGFRGGTFVMRTHNRLLTEVTGCDGLKTGYFLAAGYSIVATAKREDRRMIAVVLGSVRREVREAKAKELLAAGFAAAPVAPAPPPPKPATPAPTVSEGAPPPEPEQTPAKHRGRVWAIAAGGAVLFFLVTWIVARRRFRRYDSFR